VNRFLQALEFLTILRFYKDADNQGLGSSACYFPLIGGFLGLILIGLNNLLYKLFPPALLSLILVTTLLILTGGLHLDGLADSCDALFSGKSKQEMLAIMHDSHKGTFGIIGIITIILFKLSLLTLMPINSKNLGLFLMTVLSRYSMNISIACFPYARNFGVAKIFFNPHRLKLFLLSTLFTLILLGLTLRWVSMLTMPLVIIFTLTINTQIKKIINGLTGDTIGAVCELNEIVVLISIFILTKFSL
jgi:adenosylcobinamide-GDP ribazoletransferase